MSPVLVTAFALPALFCSPLFLFFFVLWLAVIIRCWVSRSLLLFSSLLCCGVLCGDVDELRERRASPAWIFLGGLSDGDFDLVGKESDDDDDGYGA